MAWYGMAWYGMVWYGMIWYGMVTLVSEAEIQGTHTSANCCSLNFCTFSNFLKLATRAKFAGTLSVVYFVSVEDCKSCLPAAFVDVSHSLVFFVKKAMWFLVRGH